MEIKRQGITPEAAIAQLDSMRSTASPTNKPLGTNALSIHLKQAREGIAMTASTSTNLSSATGHEVVSTKLFAFLFDTNILLRQNLSVTTPLSPPLPQTSSPTQLSHVAKKKKRAAPLASRARTSKKVRI